MSVPTAWEFVLLALAAYRVYRLIARDTITDPLRDVVSYPDATAVTLDRQGVHVEMAGGPPPAEGSPLRVYVATLIRCPWCVGFYVSLAVWILWECWPHAIIVGSVPFAIAGAVGLIAKNLDA